MWVNYQQKAHFLWRKEPFGGGAYESECNSSNFWLSQSPDHMKVYVAWKQNSVIDISKIRNKQGLPLRKLSVTTEIVSKADQIMAIVRPLDPLWDDVCRGGDGIFFATVFHLTQIVQVELTQMVFGKAAALSPTSMFGSLDSACKRTEPARFSGVQHAIYLGGSRSKPAC